MWIRAMKLSDVAEKSGKVLLISGKEVAFFKIEGKIYAIDNICPHRGGPLGEGSLEGSDIICPWHAWTFDAKTGACQSVPDIIQKTYSVKLDGDDILVDA